MFYSDEHCGGASAAGEGPVALPKGGRHLLSHAREIHLQSACQRRRSTPEVIQPGTHRHSFIIQQQQSSIWLALQEHLYSFDFFKERVNILVLNAFDIQHEIKLALIHSNLASIWFETLFQSEMIPYGHNEVLHCCLVECCHIMEVKLVANVSHWLQLQTLMNILTLMNIQIHSCMQSYHSLSS